jgi:hypothetical protein
MKAPSLTRHFRLGLACLGLASLAVIASCGGAIGSGGTGAAPQDVSGGTVTGFGSVIIDGLRFDDSRIATVAETAPGADQPAETRLGHRVELERDALGNPKALRVDATVAGSVDKLTVMSVLGGTLNVLGQTVTINGSAALGPVTQFGGGYTSALDVRAGDAIEVHGVFKPLGAAQIIQATRIEKLPALPATLRVSGIVSALGEGGSQRFALGSLAVDAGGASITPAGTALANGAAVVVLAPLAKLQASGAGGVSLAASAVRVKRWQGVASDVFSSGFVTLLDAGQGQFTLSGQTVKYSASNVQPAGALLNNGQYVQVRGGVSADGSLLATSIKLRDGSNGPEAELKGTIVGFTDASHSFQIRDTAVTLATAGVELSGCPVTGLRDGLFVELEGSLAPNGVVAGQVECKDEPSGAVIERTGLASGVDLSASTFMLTPAGKPAVPVKWTALTYFRTITPETLGRKAVEVEGILVNGELQATKVKIED